ncbi:MAG: hypothetical protein JWO81_1513, partial [Alphaproteobacteria bacterium]|nr:hypothetical protein [Alphaproteobacteria bacterium]
NTSVTGITNVAANQGIDISGNTTAAGAANVTFNGTVSVTTSATGAAGVLIDNDNGAVSFTGTSVVVNSGAGNAISFTTTTGTGATLSLTGGNLNVDTTGGLGLNATSTTTGASSLNITGANNSVASTTGGAIHIDGVTSNVTLHDVGVSGGGTTDGVWLKNTGAGGQFIVTGDAASTAGSGGTIANISGGNAASVGAAPTLGTGVYMENVSNVSLSNIIFGANAGTMSNFGIRGENVNNFTLTDSEFRGAFGDDATGREGALRFGTQNISTGLTGTALFQGNNIQGGFTDNLATFVYGANSLNLTIKDSAHDQAVFGATGTTVAGGDDFFLESGGTSTVTTLIDGANFNGGHNVQVGIISLNATTQTTTIQNSVFAQSQVTTSGSADLSITGTLTGANVNYTVQNNSFKGSDAGDIFATFNGNNGTIKGLVLNNTFGTVNGAFDSSQANRASANGGAFFGGIDSKSAGTGTINYALRFEGNTVRDFNGAYGVLLRSSTQDGGGVARLEATIKNNTFAESGPNPAAAIYGQLGGASLSTDFGKMGLDISGNSMNMTGATAADGVFLDQTSANSHYYLPGYAGPSSPTTQVSAFLVGKGNTFTNANASGEGGAGINAAGITGEAFTLAVPITAVAPPGLGWEDLVQASKPVGGDVVVVTPPGGGTPPPTGGTPPAPVDPTPPAPPTVDTGVLTQAALDTMVAAAIDRWVAAGATPEQVAAMKAVSVTISDITGLEIGDSTPGHIQVDRDAAGYGWFIDKTPGEDGEFTGSGSRLTAAAGGPAAGHIDLLSVVEHELGHQIGLSDDYNPADSADLMYGFANVGERRLATADDVKAATGTPVDHEAFVLTPVAVGTIPANTSVDISFRETVDAFAPGLAPNLAGTSTITFDPVQTLTTTETIAPTGTTRTDSGNTVTLSPLAVATLTLGDLVYKDVNKNGTFDAGDTGVGNVTVKLYIDNGTTAGVWDAGDTLVTSTTTSNVAGTLGKYQFTGLAPGDYLVVVPAANFAAAQPLNALLPHPGAVDPDNNVDNDNNGAAIGGGDVASQAITLAYDTEPTAGPGNDTNNTVDFGFQTNSPPVANTDTATVDEDSSANTINVRANDTDPDGDTFTVTATGAAGHGTVSITNGGNDLTYTPTGNYNGADSFTYTITDSHGATAQATVNVTVGPVNDPVAADTGAAFSVNEDSVGNAVSGLLISDIDATLAPAGIYSVTLSATHGTLNLTTTTGLTFDGGTSATGTTMTFHGTLANINTALATAHYSPDADYNGAAQIDIQATDSFGGIVATGTGAATSDETIVNVTVNNVNDPPSGADNSDTTTDSATLVLTSADFSTGFTDPEGNVFAGAKLASLPATGTIKLNGTAVNAGDFVTKAQLDAGNVTYTPAAGSGGTNPTFTFNVRDDGGTANGGIDTDPSANTFTIHVTASDAAPVVDLNGTNDPGNDFATSFTEGGAAVAIVDTDVLITDVDAGDNVESAVISISDPEAGDSLTVIGALPGSITAAGGGTDTITLSGTGTQAEYEQALTQIRYASSSDNPTVAGTHDTRDIGITVSDGDQNSVARTAVVTITGVNDPPSGGDATATFDEDTVLVLTATHFTQGFSDPDGDAFNGIKVASLPASGTLMFDADGAGGNPAVAVAIGDIISKADIDAGKLTYTPGTDVNGDPATGMTFQVIDNSGAANDTDPNAATLFFSINPVNDTPVVSDGAAIAATEQTAATVNASTSISDADLDAFNGGSGDYSGATLTYDRSGGADASDSFTIPDGAGFTVSGNQLLAGGLEFATFSTATAGELKVSFTSAGTAATTALVNAVAQAVQYTNTSDDPPASVDLVYTLNDGSVVNSNQGSNSSPFQAFDPGFVTVDIAAVNDAPVNVLGGTIGTGEDAVDAWLSGMSVSDSDAGSNAILSTFEVEHGTLGIRTDVVGGITAAEITFQDANTITVQASQSEINATLAAVNGLVYSPDANYNGSDTLTVTTNDRGFTGTDPGLSGDGSSEEAVSTRTIVISAVDDPPVAQPDAVSTPENVVGTGSVLADNGSGPDADADGDPITVSAVNGSAVDVGQEIVLASGAKLTVQSDGTYSYDPNGKFNHLTSTAGGETGAVNTSATDSFTYALAGGNTTTVTVTVNGVATADDWLMGDAGDNNITGTPQGDLFMLQQGGDDMATGMAANDGFYMGGALNGADQIDGGSGGNDQVALQGDYAGLVLGAGNLVNIETLALLSGT